MISACCSASAGDATEASVSGPGGRSVASWTRRHHLEADLDRRRAEEIVGIVGAQMRDRQRSAADMQRERGDARENPQPSRRLLFDDRGQTSCVIAHSQVFAISVLGVGRRRRGALSGTPSSATSLILE